MVVFSIFIIICFIFYFLFWSKVFRSPYYKIVRSKFLGEFEEKGRKYRRYEVIYTRKDFSEFLNFLIKDEMSFYKVVAFIIVLAFGLMLVGVLDHFGFFKIEIDYSALRNILKIKGGGR